MSEPLAAGADLGALDPATRGRCELYARQLPDIQRLLAALAAPPGEGA